MKTSQLKMIIREVVREEIRLGWQEIIGDMKQPKQRVVKPKTKVVENQYFSTNPIINEVLNETAASDEWKTMGGGTYDSNNMGDVLGKSYGDLMNGNTSAPITVEGQTADFLKKDYRGLMKAVEKRDKQKFGG